MKILQINSHYDQGGAARVVAGLHRQLLAEGEEAYVAYGRGQNAVDANTYRFGRLWEIYFSALMSRLSGISGWWNKAATKRLIAYIEKIRPDVIHLHTLHGYYLNLPLLFRYINAHELPVVWTFHDCYAFTGNCGYCFDCEKWKTGCKSCPNLSAYPKSLWFDRTDFLWKQKKALFTQGPSKIIVSPSEWLAQEARKSFFEKYDCITIRNAICAKNIFYPREKAACREKYGFSPKEKLILGVSVGYGDLRKGAKYIVQLAKDLENEAKVILIGWDKKEDKMLAGTTNAITLPVITDTDTLAEYYSMADVFVLPSLAENYPTVALEAMACGTPVVGFRVGGIPEQLTDGKGIAVDVGDREAFVAAVRKVLATGDKGREDAALLRGEPLAERIAKENDPQKMTKSYREVYQRLIQHKRSAK